ncbi:POC1 centriolar protein A [Phlyctochytrium planicorne]|nr:POC1 centriolar protein A [Phlyctochytrium planicorne]
MVTSVAFHPAGNIIASCSTDRSIKLFDIRTHKLIQNYGNAHVLDSLASSDGNWPSGGHPNSIAFDNGSGDWLISTGMDGLVKIYDLKEGHLFFTLHGHKFGPTLSATFSPEGDFFASGGSDSQIMVWRSNFDRLSSGEGMGRKEDAKGSLSPGRTRPVSSGGKNHFHQEGESILASKHMATHLRKDQTGANRNSGVNGSAKGRTVRSKTPEGDLYNQYADNPRIVDVGAPVLAEDVGEGEGNEGGDATDYITNPLELRTIPEQLATTLQHIVRQIDVMTQTMTIFESRMSMNEDKIVELSKTLQQLTANLSKDGPSHHVRNRTNERDQQRFGGNSNYGDTSFQQQQQTSNIKPFGGHLPPELLH